MCCPEEGYVLLANVAQNLGAFHSFLGLLLSTATLQFLSPKCALRVHGLRFFNLFVEFCIFLRIFDEFFSGFRAKFQKRVTCVAFSIKFAKTNQKFAENSEFCENYSLLFKIIPWCP